MTEPRVSEDKWKIYPRVTKEELDQNIVAWEEAIGVQWTPAMEWLGRVMLDLRDARARNVELEAEHTRLNEDFIGRGKQIERDLQVLVARQKRIRELEKVSILNVGRG